MFKNKNILLIAPSNYNYPLTIKNEIEMMGGDVHFYDERNNPTTVEKIILRLAPNLIGHKIDNYYNRIIEAEANFHPDYVLFISPESVTPQIIKRMKHVFKNSIFVLYMWDSLENKNAKRVFKYFDRCLSFDQEDCKKYKFIFRPLFFSREYDVQNKAETVFKFDFGFIGTAHSDRARVIYKIKNYCEKNLLSFYFYLYVPGTLMLLYRWLSDSYFRRLYKEGFVHTNTMSRDLVEHIMEQTRYIIDVNHPKQTGLTMRTIEMLGLKRKLLTTNINIISYDFYNSVNQIVIDRNVINFDKKIIELPYQDIKKEIYLKYRIDYWVKEVFGIL